MVTTSPSKYKVVTPLETVGYHVTSAQATLYTTVQKPYKDDEVALEVD